MQPAHALKSVIEKKDFGVIVSEDGKSSVSEHQ